MAYFCRSGPGWLAPAGFVALRLVAAIGIWEVYLTASSMPCLLLVGRDGMERGDWAGYFEERGVWGHHCVNCQPASLRRPAAVFF